MHIHRPTGATAIASVALFTALSGGAVAATQLPAGSVGTRQLRNHAVNTSKVTPWIAKQLHKLGAEGTNGQNGTNGSSGTTGAIGPQGPAGAPGPRGAGDPLTYRYTENIGPDSGDCGNNWATDTYDSVIVVSPQNDGSYLISKYVKGSFVTIAGVSEPNPGTCPGASQTGGVEGTFQGVETWSVPSPGAAQAASFDPTASCACSGAGSSEGQNAAFTGAFFPGSSYGGPTNYDFVYHTASDGSWVDSNTPANNTGNITG